MAELSDLYSVRILELAANAPGLGRLAAPDATATAHSKLCGSTVTVDLKARGDTVAEVGMAVRACVLGQAAAAVMARNIVGATSDELRHVGAQMRAMLKSGGPAPDGRWADLSALEPVREAKGRHASTLLVFDAVERALDEIEARRRTGT